jgi:hypothetical protein
MNTNMRTQTCKQTKKTAVKKSMIFFLIYPVFTDLQQRTPQNTLFGQKTLSSSGPYLLFHSLQKIHIPIKNSLI